MRSLASLTFAIGLLVAVQVIVLTDELHGQEPTRRDIANAASHIDELSKVREVSMSAPPSKKINPKKERAHLERQTTKIVQANKQGQDAFMRDLRSNRPDLQGLPFLFGGDCRMPESKIAYFMEMTQMVRSNEWAPPSFETEKSFAAPDAPHFENNELDPFHRFYEFSRLSETGKRARFSPGATMKIAPPQEHHPASIAALMQILAPEPAEKRLGLAKFLASVPHIDATKALVQLLIFSPEPDVHNAAIAGLKLRRERDYTHQLLLAFDYPYPPVAKRAADALVQLQRDDVLPQLLDVLERPDPREPKLTTNQGKETWTVRELIRINHHRNCLLCHAPVTPENLMSIAQMTTDSFFAPIPLTSEPLLDLTKGGGYFGVPHMLIDPKFAIRAEVTYLRQDFSMMLSVTDAAPWPDMQRFDFLVDTRVVTATEADARRQGLQPKKDGEISPYHAAALYALRELTGRDTEPNAIAWRRLLKPSR